MKKKNINTFDLAPPHFVHYHKEVIWVKFGHDHSTPSRAPKGLKFAKISSFTVFLT